MRPRTTSSSRIRYLAGRELGLFCTTASGGAAREDPMLQTNRLDKLDLFCTFDPPDVGRASADWLCSALQTPHFNLQTSSQLALFCRGLSNVLFTINPFPPSTCPFCRLSGIGFVLHNCPDRRHQQSYPSRPFLSVRKLALFARHPQPPACKAPSRWASPGIGFVSHNQPSPQIASMGMGSQTR